MSRLFTLTSSLLLATAASATGIRGNGDDVATKEAVHLGCFRDTHNRIFRAPPVSVSGGNTPENCQKACGPSYKYFGVQYGNGCYCGKADEDFTKFGESKGCTMSCAGDSSQKCGGVWAMDVFDMHQPKDLGCFKDKPNRLFKAPFFDQPSSNTLESCQKACGSGYKYYGLQYGRECFCGKEHENFAKYGESNDCRISCSGDGKKKCGGVWAMNVFVDVNPPALPPPPVRKGHLGCFKDQPNRIFKDSLINLKGDNTAANCQKACGPSYKYFGLQNHKQCFCGRTGENFKKYGKSNRCTQPCTGDRMQYCGGVWAMDVFDNKVDCSGEGDRLLPGERDDQDYAHEDENEDNEG